MEIIMTGIGKNCLKSHMWYIFTAHHPEVLCAFCHPVIMAKGNQHIPNLDQNIAQYHFIACVHSNFFISGNSRWFLGWSVSTSPFIVNRFISSGNRNIYHARMFERSEFFIRSRLCINANLKLTIIQPNSVWQCMTYL